MIKTKVDLSYYLESDKKRLGVDHIGLLKRKAGNIFNSEKTLLYSYLIRLRKTEWYYNNRSNVFQSLLYAQSLYRLRKLSSRVMVNIGLNTIGPGLNIYHSGGIIIHSAVRIGKNFGLQTGVVIGQTKEGMVPTIGDDVYFGPGAKAFGDITIGNNVIVAPNSVVVKDVPANCIVSGVPAVIIKDNSPYKDN